MGVVIAFFLGMIGGAVMGGIILIAFKSYREDKSGDRR